MFNALRLQHRHFTQWMRPTWTKTLKSPNDKTQCYRPSLNTSHSTRNYSTDDVTWLWEVNDVVRGFNEAAKHGTRVFAVENTYNSIRPLEPEHFKKAFDYLMRKFPNLRTVVRSKEDKSWFCQLQNYKVDFKVMSNEHTFRKECLELLDKGFQETDSLPWRARIVPRSSDSPCKMEEVKKTHPYQYDLIILANHAVADGIDAFLICDCLLYGLNCAASEVDFDDGEYGTFENNREFEISLSQRKKELLENPSKFASVRDTLPMLGHIPSTVKAFPHPNVSRPKTRYLHRDVDPHVMKGLVSKCNEMGVTFGSFAVSACNLALVEFMREAGLSRDIYELNALLYMNSRRYRSKKSHLQGCYLTALTYKSEVSTSTKATFWNYCQRVNCDLKSLYNTGFVIDQTAMQAILDAEHKEFDYTDNIRPVCHDYASNYMGDINKYISPDKYMYVKLTDVVLLQNNHNFRNALIQDIYSYNNITKHNIVYADNYFSEEAVNLIAEKIFHIYEMVGK